MRRTRIIEGRTASHAKRQRSPRDFDAPNQLILPGRVARQAYRHEIYQFSDTVRREKAGDQYVGFRPIELFRRDAFPLGRDLEPASLLVVQDGGEHARRIEEGNAEPINGTVHADERRRPHVADDAVIFNGLVRHG